MNPDYKLYHPKWHRRRMPIFWWLEKGAYVRFIARELTSIPVVYGALLVVAEVWALGQGEESFRRFNELLASPPMLVVNALALGGILFHALTWLHLAPKAMVVELGGRRVPAAQLLAGQYLGWIAATASVAWWLLGGGS